MSITAAHTRLVRVSVIIFCSIVALVGFGMVGSANTDLNQHPSVTADEAAGPAAPTVSLNVSSTADVATNFGACGNGAMTTSSGSLREAICAANNAGAASSTITVSAGTYVLTNGELQMGKVSGSNITLNGSGAANTIISGNNLSRVFDLDVNIVGGVTTTISNVTITNGLDATFGGAGIIAGSGHATSLDTLTVNNCIITNNTVNTTTSNKPGGGIGQQGGNLIISNSTISNNSSGGSAGGGVSYTGEGAGNETLQITNTTFSGNHANISVANINLGGGALETAASSSGTPTFTVTNSRFINNTVTATGTAIGHGGAIFSQTGPLSVTGSTFTGNTVTGGAGQYGGAVSVTANTVNLHYNRITGNTATNGSGVAIPYANGTIINATENWWGCNTGPGTTGCDTVFGGPTVSPRLVLTATASPATVVGPNATSTINAALTTDSLGGAVGSSNLTAFAGLPVSFTDPLPSGATLSSASSNISSGVATTTYNSQNTSGPGHVLATLDNGTGTATITVNRPPAITSSNGVVFSLNTPGSFTVTTTGYPTAAITKTGTLPAGVTFTDNGNGTATVAGTPTAAGSFPLSLTANNGVSPNAIQTLTVTVNRPSTTVSSVNRVTSTPTNASSVQWTVTFANAVSGLTASDLTLTQTAGTCSSTSVGTITAVGGSPATAWTVNANTGTGDCTLRLDVANDTGLSHSVTNVPFTTGNTIVVDKTAPTVTVAAAAGQANPALAGPINFTATFSEAITGFDQTDILVSGTATYTGGSPTVVVTNPSSDGKTFNVAVSGMVTSGTVAVQVKAGAGQDQASNTNAASAISSGVQYQVSSRKARSDFDGDGRTDVSVFRASDGSWYMNNSTTGYASVRWGQNGDVIVPGDYDGDGKADFAVWRPTATANVADFYILNSNGFTISGYEWGSPGDVPVTGDYDGDGKTDVAIYRPADGYWWIFRSQTQTYDAFQFGSSGDVPMVMDFNGDGKTDLAVYRSSDRTWYLANAADAPSHNAVGVQWGISGDKLVPADYDGDGKDDVAVYRPSNGTWYILRSSDAGMTQMQFGSSTDIPVAGDYDGDGKDDVAVWRPSSGTWYLNRSLAGFAAIQFGTNGDKPVPSAFAY